MRTSARSPGPSPNSQSRSRLSPLLPFQPSLLRLTTTTTHTHTVVVMFLKRRSDSQLPLSYAGQLGSPSHGAPSAGHHSANTSTHSLALRSPSGLPHPNDPYNTQPQPLAQQVRAGVERARLHQTLAATSEVLVALDAAREAAQKLGAAERALAKHACALGKLFRPSKSSSGSSDGQGQGGESESVSRCLAAVGALFEAVGEVDARHAAGVKQRYEAANGTADKWFKRTAKEEKAFAADMNELEAKTAKAHANFAKVTGSNGKGRGGGGASQAIEANQKYIEKLAHLTHASQAVQMTHAARMTEQREAAVSEIARLACELAEETWGNRIAGMRAAGLKVAEVKEMAAWCTPGVLRDETTRDEPDMEMGAERGLQLSGVQRAGSIRGPRGMAPPAEVTSQAPPSSSRGVSFSTEHSSRQWMSSGVGQYTAAFGMAPLFSPAATNSDGGRRLSFASQPSSSGPAMSPPPQQQAPSRPPLPPQPQPTQSSDPSEERRSPSPPETATLRPILAPTPRLATGSIQSAAHQIDYFNQRPGTSDVSAYSIDHQEDHSPQPPLQHAFPEGAWGDSISSSSRPPPLRQTSSFVMPQPIISPAVEPMRAEVSPPPSDPKPLPTPMAGLSSSKLARSDSRVAKLVQRYSLPPIATTTSLSWDPTTSRAQPHSALPTSTRNFSPPQLSSGRESRSSLTPSSNRVPVPTTETDDRRHPGPLCSCADCTKMAYRQGETLTRKDEERFQRELRTPKRGAFGRMWSGVSAGGKKTEVDKMGWAQG